MNLISVILFFSVIANVSILINGADESCPLKCYNGGECKHDQPVDYSCVCPKATNNGVTTTFTGTWCETPMVLCEIESVSFSCLNGASCNATDNSCNCPNEFSGKFCENGPVTCYFDVVCYNGGTCRDLYERKESECLCSSGFTGDRCEIVTQSDFVKKSSTLKGFSTGSIIGIAVGALFGVILLGVVIRRVYKRCTGGDIEMTS